MIELNSDGFILDESKSNPMTIAFRHEKCPHKEICVILVSSMMQELGVCRHFDSDGKQAFCKSERTEP